MLFRSTLLPTSSLTLHFVHAITWCLFQSFGLGVLLRAQSQSKFLVRHYLKHYHYPQHDRGQGAVHEAFQNWKTIYNLSMCMTYGMYGWCNCVRCCGRLLMVPGSVLCVLGVEDVFDSSAVDRW